MRRPLMAALAALACVLVPAGTAQASRSQESIVQDDRMLVLSGDGPRERTLDQIKALGADEIHSLVFWSMVTPRPHSNRRPHFNEADPAAYPPALWDKYDSLVRGATARGISVMLTPTGPMPAWASGCHGGWGIRQDCRPGKTHFRRFVEALGKRYSGTYHDENQGGGVLPRVSHWSIWNEPNQGGWLKPQYSKHRGRVVPEAVYRYRNLVYAAVSGLRRTGHSRDRILLGETAPLGRDSGRLLTRPIAPVKFYRRLFCLNNRGHRLRGRAARRYRGCSHFKRLRVDGVAHHPYTDGAARSPSRRGKSGWIMINSLWRLEHVLDQAARYHRIRRGAPIYLTEHGFQTDPPDKRLGVSLRHQAAWINESNWLAYRRPRVRSIAQYQIADEPSVGTFNTGLLTATGAAKPSFEAYRMPLWVMKRRSGHGRHRHRIVKLFGQARLAQRGDTVEVQFRYRHGHYRTLKRVRITNSRGYFVRRFRWRRGYWRLKLDPGHGHAATLLSRTAKTPR